MTTAKERRLISRQMNDNYLLHTYSHLVKNKTKCKRKGRKEQKEKDDPIQIVMHTFAVIFSHCIRIRFIFRKHCISFSYRVMGSTLLGIFLSRILCQYATHDTLDAFIFLGIQVRVSPTRYLDWTYNSMHVPYNPIY